MERYLGSDRILYGVLRKALYGCVQASRLWYLKLSQFLKDIGYTNSEIEPCVFRKVEGDTVYLMIVYVDDLLIIASAEEIKRRVPLGDAGYREAAFVSWDAVEFPDWRGTCQHVELYAEGA
jgi:hypothetical protein